MRPCLRSRDVFLGLVVLATVACSDSSCRSTLAAPPAERASPAFWRHWGDGRAELAGYAVKVERYGELRDGEAVLIWVTEPMDTRTWIKDERGSVPDSHRANVMKLNHTLSFRTGIYPYSVMTSVFAPVDGRFERRFAPARLSFSAQEWCGHVFASLARGPAGWEGDLHSYFQAEGDRELDPDLPDDALFEDALWIQLRELDGPFNGGRDWEGRLVPAMWSARREHRGLAAVPARIERAETERDGAPVTRFTIVRGERRRTIDVERAEPHRILGWSGPDGEEGRLLGSARLAYWELNDVGDESWLSRLGLPAR